MSLELNRRGVVAAGLAVSALASPLITRAQTNRLLDLSAPAPTRPFPHVWEACVGSDRASVALRAQWQEDLAVAKRLSGFRSVRFHGLLDDDMAVCRRIGPNGPELNFLYVDQAFDRMLEIGVKPFVELSFMPKPLASSDNTIFWYKGNTSPPERMADWAAVIGGLGRHLVDRYGLREVSSWRFECWNEPNLNFWAADQQAYFELYGATARALKAVSPQLKVGGPATAQLMWIPEFLAYCAMHNAPVDFVSTHVYPDDPQTNLFGREMKYPREEVMPHALRRARAQIDASDFPHAPLAITEWSSQNPAFIAQMARDCSSLCDTLSYWTFDNIFEEIGPTRSFDNDDYGLIGWRGIPRPSFNTFVLMHRLGQERIDTAGAPVIATRRPDGGLAVLAWNLITVADAHGTSGNPMAGVGREPIFSGAAVTLDIRLPTSARARPRLTLIDPSVNPMKRLYAAMGRPAYPTASEIDKMKRAAALPPSAPAPERDGLVTLTLPANAVALLET